LVRVAFLSSNFVSLGSADLADTNVLGEIDSDVFVGSLTRRLIEVSLDEAPFFCEKMFRCCASA
jgi:hypothetical protein